MPVSMQPLLETWKKHHPSWEYRLWGNEEVAKFDFPEKHLFHKAPRLNMKADILRLAILREFGGLYVDTDMECLRTFSSLINTGRQGFVAIEPNGIICNAMIGAIPNAEFLGACLANIYLEKSHYDFKETLNKTGPGLIDRVIRNNYLNQVRIHPASLFYYHSISEQQKNKHIHYIISLELG